MYAFSEMRASQQLHCAICMYVCIYIYIYTHTHIGYRHACMHVRESMSKELNHGHHYSAVRLIWSVHACQGMYVSAIE
jgi:hypothetical protein